MADVLEHLHRGVREHLHIMTLCAECLSAYGAGDGRRLASIDQARPPRYREEDWPGTLECLDAIEASADSIVALLAEIEAADEAAPPDEGRRESGSDAPFRVRPNADKTPPPPGQIEAGVPPALG